MRGWIAGLLVMVLGGAGVASATGMLPPPGDSGDSGFVDTGDTGGDSGDPATDTADSGSAVPDTGDTGLEGDDTAPPGYSAAQKAGEKGGFSCSTAGGTGTAGVAWALLLGAALRRREADPS